MQIRLVVASALIATAGIALAQAPATPSVTGVVLDHAVAVVNEQVILASDVDDEVRLSVLDPNLVGQGTLTPSGALDQLISRALIQQQISQEDAQSSAPSQVEVDARLAEIRNQLPACVHERCASETGWKTFLTTHGLTPERVAIYLTYRLEILRFIELRFRPAIRITDEEIENYYRHTLVPQYAAGDTVPTLVQVSARVEEILLQQQVNALFDQWLTNLRKQGDVEILDPAFEGPASETPSGGKP